MSFVAQSQGSEGFVSEPQLFAGRLTGAGRLRFGNAPVNSKLISPEKQPEVQDRGFPRVYYCGGTPRQLRAVFAGAGFLRTEELLQATVVWARPQEAAEVQGLLGEGQWLNGLPELEPILFKGDEKNQKKDTFSTKQRCFVLLAEAYPYSVYLYNRGISVEAKEVKQEPSKEQKDAKEEGAASAESSEQEPAREYCTGELPTEKLEALALLVNKKMQKVAAHLSKTDHMGPRRFSLLALDFYDADENPVVSSGVNFAYKENQIENDVTLGFLVQALNVLGIPFEPRPKLVTPSITVPKRPHRVPEDPQYPKFVAQNGYFYQLVNGQYAQVDQKVYQQYFNAKEAEFRTKIKAWKQQVRSEAARAREFFQELAAWREQQAEEEELRKQQIAEHEEEKVDEEQAAKERLEKMKQEEKGIEVKTYGVSQKVLGLPAERRARIVKTESLFYDYKLYSRLMAELRAAGGRFAELKESELTEYEAPIIQNKIEELERAAAENFTALYPAEDVRQYMRLPQRRYLNELVGCALRNGLYPETPVQQDVVPAPAEADAAAAPAQQPVPVSE